MASHVVAIGASWMAYRYVLRKQGQGKSVNTARALSIVGLINALALAVIAFSVIYECITRISQTIDIQYREAILVSLLGLVVNLVSARILHHHDDHTDDNLKAAYLHVLADVLTSALALTALIVGYYSNITNLDTAVGIFGSLVILNWSRKIIFNSIKEIKNDKHDRLHHA